MINLSVDTRNLSSSMSADHLKVIFDEVFFLVESSFEVSIEDTDGDNSYWIPTPDDEVDELEIFGIIEIGTDTTPFQKVVHLAHETGHAILHSDPYFKESTCVLFNESMAWYLGYHFLSEHGYVLDMKEYIEELEYALDLYRRSENARDVK
jgi:hypothetical protein